MKKQNLLIPIIILILSLIIFNRMCSSSSEKLNEIVNEQKKLIGREVVIKNDTLIIIDYNMFKSSYLLNNGLTIDQNYAKKILLDNEGI